MTERNDEPATDFFTVEERKAMEYRYMDETTPRMRIVGKGTWNPDPFAVEPTTIDNSIDLDWVNHWRWLYPGGAAKAYGEKVSALVDRLRAAETKALQLENKIMSEMETDTTLQLREQVKRLTTILQLISDDDPPESSDWMRRIAKESLL